MSLGRIPIPEEWMGKPVKGAMKKALAGAEAKPEVEQERELTPDNSNLNRKENYIILPGKNHGSYEYPDLIVPFERKYFNQDWSQAWSSLRNDGELMLTIRQYVDFLNLLKSGSAFDGNGNRIPESRLSDLYKEITEVKSPWRAEWLDASFENKSTGKTLGFINRIQLHVAYHVLDSNGNLREVSEPVENYLGSDKTPGIDFDYWLQNATPQGLPSSDNPKGQLYYWSPRSGRVARFDADSNGTYLGCDRGPSVSNTSLGVRAARAKK